MTKLKGQPIDDWKLEAELSYEVNSCIDSLFIEH